MTILDNMPAFQIEYKYTEKQQQNTRCHIQLFTHVVGKENDYRGNRSRRY
jgi:hypothetical protein